MSAKGPAERTRVCGVSEGVGGWGPRPDPLYPWEPHKVSHRTVGTQDQYPGIKSGLAIRLLASLEGSCFNVSSLK